MKKALKGNTIYNRNECISTTFVVLWAVWVLVFLAAGVLFVNAQFNVSICNPAGGTCTGSVRSDLWTSTGWIATCMFGTNLFFLLGYQMLLAFGRNRVCMWVWIAVMVVTWMVLMIAWVLLLSQWVNCNRPGDPSNICSSLERCLVPEFFNDLANLCPNSPFGTRAYTLALSDLQPRQDFKWLFGTVSAFVFGLNLALLVLVFVVWCGVTFVK